MSDSEEEGIERQVKLVLAGAPQPSVGVEFYLKRLALGSERNVSVQLWDIAGSSLKGRMTDKYLYGAHGLLLVYDVTASGSLDALQDWVNAVKRASRGHDRPPMLALVANKADMEHARQGRKNTWSTILTWITLRTSSVYQLD
ncbi:Ras-related protein Rab-28 [Armadillidium vulgare]|nr:Ras-related protein Rab-28 [Armadillidium vulgare]